MIQATLGFTKVRSEVPNLKKIVAGVDLTAFPDAAATVLFSTFTTCMAA